VESLSIALEDGEPPVLRLSGELDVATADRVHAALHDALARESSLVVDMAGVEFIDASGLRPILQAAASLNGAGPLTLVNAPLVSRLLELIGQADIPTLAIRTSA
jgi:anti-anti-sigma factor